MVRHLLDSLLNAPAALVYAVVGAMVFLEDALFVGFVLPGETAAVLGGVAASRGQVNLAAMIILVVVAAILGDTVGYEVGRHLGTRILDLPTLRNHQERVGGASALLARRGGSAVFLGRFIAFFRAVMPALAGTARMPYRRFLAYNAAGGICWGVGVVLLGYIAGNSYQAVEKAVGRWAAVAVALLVVTFVVIWRVRRHRAERRGARA